MQDPETFENPVQVATLAGRWRSFFDRLLHQMAGDSSHGVVFEGALVPSWWLAARHCG